MINTYSDVIIEQHKETTTTPTNATTSAVTIQQSEEEPQTSTPLPVLPTEPHIMTDTPSTINQPETSLGLGQSLDEQTSQPRRVVALVLPNQIR